MPRLPVTGLLLIAAVIALPRPAAATAIEPAPSVRTDDGVWSLIIPPSSGPGARREVAAAYDPIGDRMIVFGGVPQSAATWSLSLGASPAWTQLVTLGAPAPRVGATMVYDRARHRMVMLFGNADTGFSSEVWTLNLTGPPEWSPISASGPPPPRSHSVGVYDEAGDRVVIYGGLPGPQGDLWELRLATNTWTRIQPQGPSPPPRWGGFGYLDPATGRLVVALGAVGISSAFSREAWAFDFSSRAWTLLSATGPERSLAPVVVDPPRRRVVLYGGYLGTTTPASDTWAMSMETGAWTQLATIGY